MRIPRYLRAVLAAVLVICSAGTFGGADAQVTGALRSGRSGGTGVPEVDALTAHAHSAAVTRGGTDYGIPPYTGETDPAIQTTPWAFYEDPVAQVSKSKLSITLPRTEFIGYIKICIAGPNGDGTYYETCCPSGMSSDPTCHKIDPPAVSPPIPNEFWDQAIGRIWPSPDNPSHGHYGTFPPIQIRGLAFGAVPVTATAHLELTKDRDGFYKPLDFDLTLQGAVAPTGTRVTGFAQAAPSPSFFYKPVSASALVRLSIDNVTVDGRRVPLAQTCQTATAATLSLSSPGGWRDTAAASAESTPPAGVPGTFELSRGGHLYGNLNIPRFKGCTSGHEDLSPLLSAIASSDTNPVSTTNATFLEACGSVVPCPPYPSAPYTASTTTPHARPGDTSAPTPAGSARWWQRLGDAQRNALARNVQSLPAALRNPTLAAFPPFVRMALQARMRSLRP